MLVAISEAAVETVAALIDTAAVAAMAALVAVMIMVSIGTFSWDSIRKIREYPPKLFVFCRLS